MVKLKVLQRMTYELPQQFVKTCISVLENSRLFGFSLFEFLYIYVLYWNTMVEVQCSMFVVVFFQGILDWVMDSTKRDNKEVQGKLMALQKEKDQVQQNVFPFGPSPIL